MRTFLITSVAVFFALPLHAAVVDGDLLGTTEVDIRTALESNGYVVEGIETDGDEIEVDAMLDGVAVEIELSALTGAVIEIETDDDADSDDK